MGKVTLTTKDGQNFVYETKGDMRQAATDALLHVRSLRNSIARFNSSTQVGRQAKRREGVRG